MIAPRVTNHKPPSFGETFFPDLQGASSSYHEKKISSAWIMDFLDHFLFGVELLLFFLLCCLCYELLALSNHIIISGLLFFGGAEEFVLYLR